MNNETVLEMKPDIDEDISQLRAEIASGQIRRSGGDISSYAAQTGNKLALLSELTIKMLLTAESNEDCGHALIEHFRQTKKIQDEVEQVLKELDIY